jgi:hypothetical protein
MHVTNIHFRFQISYTATTYVQIYFSDFSEVYKHDFNKYVDFSNGPTFVHGWLPIWLLQCRVPMLGPKIIILSL